MAFFQFLTFSPYLPVFQAALLLGPSTEHWPFLSPATPHLVICQYCQWDLETQSSGWKVISGRCGWGSGTEWVAILHIFGCP